MTCCASGGNQAIGVPGRDTMQPYILLLDDNDDLVNNLKVLLEMEGYTVCTSLDVPNALQMINKEKPGLIVADIKIPGMDGFEFFKTLKADRNLARIPFVFLSALTSVEDVHRGMTLGANDYITKPFNIEQFLAVIRRYL
jgi:DNA-binding response OmpR family regulator